MSHHGNAYPAIKSELHSVHKVVIKIHSLITLLSQKMKRRNILSNLGQVISLLLTYSKAQSKLPEDGPVGPKHVEASIKIF